MNTSTLGTKQRLELHDLDGDYAGVKMQSFQIHGRDALILPCLGRTEKDQGAKELQGITVEDSMSMVHLSYGMKNPCSPHLRSESAIIAGIAKASLPNTATPWEEYAADYNLLRDKVAEAGEGFEPSIRRPPDYEPCCSPTRSGAHCIRRAHRADAKKCSV